VIFSSFFNIAAVQAARPGSSLAPNTTKGWVSVPNVDDLKAKWNETQFGQLLKDPAMKPFAEDLKKQLKEKLSETGIRLGVTWEDLQGVCAGEFCAGLIQPGGDKKQHALAMMVDITGRRDKADALLKKIAEGRKAKGVTESATKMGNTEVTVFTWPKKEDEKSARKAYYFIKDDMLVATDHEKVAQGILGRFAGGAADSLDKQPAFKAAMNRCMKESGAVAPHIRWFVEPFGYAEILRAAQGGRKKRGTDILKVLRQQGFTAIQGAGGVVTFATGEHELLHRTFIYAPPVNDPPAEKYNLAARILDFGSGDVLTTHTWISREVATYLTFNWNVQNAFYRIDTLVNAMAGDEVYWDVIDSLRDDPHGPMLDIRNDFIANFGQRMTMITDYELPITPKCERMLFAIELIDPTERLEKIFDELDGKGNGDKKLTANEVPKARKKIFERLLRQKEFDKDGDKALTKEEYVKARSVATTLNIAMASDPDARRLKYGEHTIWEIIKEPEEEQEDVIVVIDAPGFYQIGDEEEEEEEKEKPLLPNSAVTVARGHLIIASNVNFLTKILTDTPKDDLLANAADYRQVNIELDKLGAAKNNFRFFSRTDEAYRPTYELIRQGKMPEAETMLGKALNRLLGPEEEGELREQQIDGRKLPDYQVVRRYFGPAGIFVRTEKDGSGWLAVGVVLAKDPSETPKKDKPVVLGDEEPVVLKSEVDRKKRRRRR